MAKEIIKRLFEVLEEVFSAAAKKTSLLKKLSTFGQPLGNQAFFIGVGLFLLLNIASALFSLSDKALALQAQILLQNSQELANAQKTDEAINSFEKALTLGGKPDSSEYLLAGKLYLQEKQLTKSLAFLQKAQELNPDLSEADFLSFLITLSQNPAQAKIKPSSMPPSFSSSFSDFDNTTNQYSKNIGAAKILLLANQPYLAQPLLQKILAQNSTNPLALVYSGLAESKLQNKLMAQKYWWQAVKLDPNNKDLIATIISLNNQTDDFSRVLRERVVALEKTKD